MDFSTAEINIKKIEHYVKNAISEKRYEHSFRVAQTAVIMSKIYDLDEKKAYLAGISHDMCKEISPEEMLALAQEDGMPITEIEKNKIYLLHGRAAAVLLRQKFRVNDSDVIQAVAFHVFGGINLCDLAKVIFAADKIEPGRPHSTESYRKKLFSKPLNEMVLAVLEEEIEYHEKSGKTVAPASYDFRDELKKSIKEKK